MRTIFRIFKSDVKGLWRNKLALLIALAICVLPSLYAWFNIYSNWDPYSNTGTIPVAVVSVDKGYTKSDGEFVVMGDTVIDNLKENDKMRSTVSIAVIIMLRSSSVRISVRACTVLRTMIWYILLLPIMKMRRRIQLLPRLRIQQKEHCRQVLMKSLLMLQFPLSWRV